VTGTVGNDELSPGCRSVPVGHVNGDALLTFGPKSVGDKAEIEVADAALFRRGHDGVKLIVE